MALARKMLGWPKRCKLAHAFLWADSGKRLKLAQLLGQLGVFLTFWHSLNCEQVLVIQSFTEYKTHPGVCTAR
jgi:hypothetical protein